MLLPALLFATSAAGADATLLRCFPPPQSAPGDQAGVGQVSLVRVGTPLCEGCPPVSCRNDSVLVTIGGVESGCTVLHGFQEVQGNRIRPTLLVDIRQMGGACPDIAYGFCAYLRLPPGFAPTGEFTLRQVVSTFDDPPRILSEDSTTVEVARRAPCVPVLAPSPASVQAELGAARPHPFARTTRFAVSLSQEAIAELTIHDVTGRRLATLASGRWAPGVREFSWDGSGAREGVYFARLSVDGRVLSQRVVLLRNGR